MMHRCVIHVDLDGFYAQCEIHRLGLPRSAPLAVVQWGTLIAANYAAKAHSVTRGITGEQARALCPTITLVEVETVDSAGRSGLANSAGAGKDAKVSLERYRIVSQQIFAIFASEIGSKRLEKGSIDEAFIDATDLATTAAHAGELLSNWAHDDSDVRAATGTLSAVDAGEAAQTLAIPSQWAIVGLNDKILSRMGLPTGSKPCLPLTILPGSAASGQFDPFRRFGDRLLLEGMRIASRVRQAVEARMGFTCSAGVAHNKLLAKLASAMHKPAQQTAVPAGAVLALLQHVPLGRLRGFGGKLGRKVASLLPASSASPFAEPANAGACLPAMAAAADHSLDEDEEEGDDDEATGDRNGHGDGAVHVALLAADLARRVGSSALPAADSASQSGSSTAGRGGVARPVAASVPRSSAQRRGGWRGTHGPPKHVMAGDAHALSLRQLREALGDQTGVWVYHRVRGGCEEAVEARTANKSLLAAKSFSPVTSSQAARKWLRLLCSEFAPRLVRDRKEYGRRVSSLSLHYRPSGGKMRAATAQVHSGLDTALQRACDAPKSAYDSPLTATTVREPAPASADGPRSLTMAAFAAAVSTRGDQILVSALLHEVEPLLVKALARGALPCTGLALSAHSFVDGPKRGQQTIVDRIRAMPAAPAEPVLPAPQSAAAVPPAATATRDAAAVKAPTIEHIENVRDDDEVIDLCGPGSSDNSDQEEQPELPHRAASRRRARAFVAKRIGRSKGQSAQATLHAFAVPAEAAILHARPAPKRSKPSQSSANASVRHAKKSTLRGFFNTTGC